MTMNKYLNYWGLIFIIVILIPNIVFAITCKDGFENRYKNKLVGFLEQIARFGCFICMFLVIPSMSKGYYKWQYFVVDFCGDLCSMPYSNKLYECYFNMI